MIRPPFTAPPPGSCRSSSLPLVATALMTLGLTAVASAADTLSVGGADPGAGGTSTSVPFRFANEHEIVGMQFELSYPSSQIASLSVEGTSPSTNHRFESRELAAGRRKIVVYSATNQLLPSDLILQVPLTLTATAPQGGPTLSVSQLVLTDKAGRTFTPQISYPAIDEWRRSHFSESELADGSITGDERDPDGDGLSNLGEYLAGSNPKQADAPPAKPAMATSGGVSYLTLTWMQARSATGAAAEPEISNNLRNWSTTGVTAAPTGRGDAHYAEWQASVQRSGDKLFLRLNFKRVNP